MKRYKHIFFDLDHTLWDFDKNSELALKKIIVDFDLDKLPSFNFDSFYKQFQISNDQLWHLFALNKIDAQTLRNQRFEESFAPYDFDKDRIKSDFNEAYINICSSQGHLKPYCLEMLDALHDHYHLHILTNGFEHIQYKKLITSNIFHFFDNIFTPLDSGFTKPHSEYFNFVLQKLNSNPESCVMIGDSLEVDVLGAQRIGIDAIWIPEYESPQEIPDKIKVAKSLKDLIDFFKS